jgi:hypothetical protein
MHRPIWELFIDGSDTPVAWIAHRPNVRFAIYNPGIQEAPPTLQTI